MVLNPGKLAVIYASMKKTDKEDALKIARLLETMREEYLPLIPLPSEAEEEMRRLVSSQMFLKKKRTRLINRLHALFVAAFMSINRMQRTRTSRATELQRCV